MHMFGALGMAIGWCAGSVIGAVAAVIVIRLPGCPTHLLGEVSSILRRDVL